MKKQILIVTLASVVLLGQSLLCATTASKDFTSTATASNTTKIAQSTGADLADLISSLLKKTPNALVRYKNDKLSLFCNIPILSTIGKGVGASFLIAFFGIAAAAATNQNWGYNSSGSTHDRGKKCIAVTAACVLLGAASAYGVYRILNDMRHKLQARFSSIPLLALSPEGISVWGKELASWDAIGSIETFEQIEGLNGVFEPVPTLCIYNTAHQCLMVLPQALLPLPAAQIVELASTYKSVYQTTTATH